MTIFSISHGAGRGRWYRRGMEEEVESIPEALCYKQRLEKSTGAEMFLMTWSPVADLLAAACTDHSVSCIHDPCDCSAQIQLIFTIVKVLLVM